MKKIKINIDKDCVWTLSKDRSCAICIDIQKDYKFKAGGYDVIFHGENKGNFSRKSDAIAKAKQILIKYMEGI